MDAPQYPATLIGQLRANGGKGIITDDPSSERLSLQPLHDKTIAQVIFLCQHVVDLWRRNTRLASLTHQ